MGGRAGYSTGTVQLHDAALDKAKAGRNVGVDNRG